MHFGINYNTALIQPGSIDFWFSEEFISKWRNTNYTRKKGWPEEYANDAILCALVIRTIYHLPLRALQDFFNSLILSLNLFVKTPSYTESNTERSGLEVIKKVDIFSFFILKPFYEAYLN